MPVKNFCKHQIEVFQAFKTRYRFLPDKFKKSRDWLTFFENIGLRLSLTTDEYLNLCTAVSRGEHEDVRTASEVLIEHLFSDTIRTKQKWHTDVSFLTRLASIPFVCTELQPEYEWICSAAIPCNKVKSGDKCIGMTKLSEATLASQACLLWTVKCVVSLPGYLAIDEQMVKHLGVTQTAKLSLVIENITNICASSKLTSQNLFDQYPESFQKPKEGKDVVSVFVHHFQFIGSAQMSVSDYNVLAELPCIPVYGTKDAKFKWQVVLVKPQCVISTKYSELEFFHPFLHLLPPQLATTELTNIGLHDKLQEKHMQIVLEAAHDISQEDELDDNTKKTVVQCIKYLYNMLKKTSESHLESQLKPLYLPTVEHKLALSTELVYADSPSYRVDMILDLSDTNYQELSMEDTLYEFSDQSFCRRLPGSLKPIGLSEISTMDVASNCKEVDDSPVVQKLKNTLSLDILSKGCLSAVQCITQQPDIYKALETPIIGFLSNIKVVSLQHLKTSVVLNTSGRKIGEAQVPCFLKPSTFDSFILYVDSGLDKEEAEDEPVSLLLSHIMCIIEKQIVADVNLRKIEDLLRLLLKAQTAQRVKTILDKHAIDLEGIAMEKVEFSIGSEIPECWKHRLDQTPDNVFHSGEKVGYEKSRGQFIFAEVLDPVLPNGYTDFDSIARIEMQYTVFIKEEDEEGQIISVLDLYKLLRSSQPAIEEQLPESKAVLLYDGETYATRKSLQKEDIEDIKKELMDQLDKIWRLPEEDKQKAIKRLYLKWHPDKNPENECVAEEIFKFLVSEIERRGNVRLPKAKWDNEARTQGFYWGFESQHYSKPQASSANWWGSSGYASPSRHSAGSATQRSRRMYQTPFDRGDFQIKGNQVEANRWLRQALVDVKLLDILFKALLSEPDIACGVCFQAHQVAEKSLKAGKIYVFGLSEKAVKTTKLVTHAYGLQSKLGHRASELPTLVSPLDDYLQKTRYPDFCDPPYIPATLFSYEQAAVAAQNAKSILIVIQKIVV